MGRVVAPGVLAFLALISLSSPGIAGDSGRSSELDLPPEQQQWLDRLATSLEELTAARDEVERLERELVVAKNRDYPRGAALRALREAAVEARRELVSSGVALRQQLHAARRLGINPYLLRDYDAALRNVPTAVEP